MKKLSQNPGASDCLKLIEEKNANHPVLSKGTKINFVGVEGLDVYNTTSPFEIDGKTIIAGRVEPRDDGLASVIYFFEKKGDDYVVIEDAPTYRLQDPFYTFIDGELVLGGVMVDLDPNNSKECTGWKTVFYKGKSIYSLEQFLVGPYNMKDIRFGQMKDGRIAVFSRPHELECGGRIGFTIADKLSDVTAQMIADAPIMFDQMVLGNRGGSNQVHLLSNGLLGVVGHITYVTEPDVLHYHSMSFVINPETGEHSPIKVIATRSDFPDGEDKEPRLHDVLFTSGLVRNGDGTATLYTGVSDAEEHYITITDPFAEFEQ